jgi:putative peptidoglycan binding protein
VQTSKGLTTKEKNFMRILVVSLCSLALVSIAVGAQTDEKKSKPKKQAQTAQHATQPIRHPAAGGGGAGGKKTPTATSGGQKAKTGQGSTAAYKGQKPQKSQTSTGAYEGQKGKRAQTSNTAYQTQKGKKNRTQAERQTAKAANERQTIKANAGQMKGAGKPNQAKTVSEQNTPKGKFAKNKPLKPEHFNLAKQPNTAKAPPVKFQQGRRIVGSQNWQGQQYTVFRNYKSEWHDQNWWHNHYRNNIVFVFGAPYYWNAGYWFPAWGYYPNAYYAWDGPIYAYNRLPPDQVIANVQAALQQQGYYRGEVDGLIGPLTRGAIADYQRDHGLYMTSTIDQPTLQSLGMA